VFIAISAGFVLAVAALVYSSSFEYNTSNGVQLMLSIFISNVYVWVLMLMYRVTPSGYK
jgi:hypothetical protein